MTRDEAIQVCHGLESNWFMSDSIRDAMTVAIEALKEKTYPAKNVAALYDSCDQFVCSNCGIELQDWHRVERDEDDGDVTHQMYSFRYCPNCGARVVNDK